MVKHVSLGFLTNDSNILLYLRDDRPDIPYPDYWSPLGGQIEPGETPLEALEREIQEEVGSRAHNLAFMGRLEISNDALCDDHVIYLFKGAVHDSLEDMYLTEGQRLAYFTMDEFLALKFPEVLRLFILEKL